MSIESIGNCLKREREMRRISLKEVSNRTRVPLKYLEALESDQFDVIPGLFFAKSYLKAYAQFIGLAPDHLLSRLDDSFKKKSSADHKSLYAHPTYRIIAAVIVFTLILFGILWAAKN